MPNRSYREIESHFETALKGDDRKGAKSGLAVEK
jgi:hypothetical protein